MWRIQILRQMNQEKKQEPFQYAKKLRELNEARENKISGMNKE